MKAILSTLICYKLSGTVILYLTKFYQYTLWITYIVLLQDVVHKGKQIWLLQF